jgi:metal-responsive CopG/Arc/MetJ family transcriptional regulator
LNYTLHMRDRKEKITISIDPVLLKKINQKARQENRSRSNYIELMMIKEIGEQFTVKMRYIR